MTPPSPRQCDGTMFANLPVVSGIRARGNAAMTATAVIREAHRRYESGLGHEAEALDTTGIATTESTDVGKNRTDMDGLVNRPVAVRAPVNVGIIVETRDVEVATAMKTGATRRADRETTTIVVPRDVLCAGTTKRSNAATDALHLMDMMTVRSVDMQQTTSRRRQWSIHCSCRPILLNARENS